MVILIYLLCLCLCLLQVEQLEYDELTEPQVADIQAQIEASIIHTVEKSRGRRFPTRWNRYASPFETKQ